MAKSLKIYVAGPISKGNVVLNVRKAIDAGEQIRQRGHHPFVPHLTTFSWYYLYVDSLSLDASVWESWNLAWLDCCDYLVRLPGESAGSDAEVEYAVRKGIRVFFGMDRLLESL